MKKSSKKRSHSEIHTGEDASGPDDNVALKTQEKRRRDAESADEAVIHTDDGFRGQMGTAYALARAIGEASLYAPSIGYSVCTYAARRPPAKNHQEVLDKLRAINDKVPHPYKYGTFRKPFHLRVTRAGCEYDGDVAPESSSIEVLLDKWYTHTAVSPYGDVKTLKTKVDTNVRDAREILASEFTVDPKLLKRVRKKWAKRFTPENVRVEPYKIHLYGPDGHFKSHRDTPELGLVGTFLVGLGDTHRGTEYDFVTQTYQSHGNFHIGKDKLHAKACSWVAFYPDVPHSVERLWKSYRAAIAFKIFSTGVAPSDAAADRAVKNQRRVKAVLDTIPLPYGILLNHQYSIGTEELNGYDAVVFSAARLATESKPHILPVIIETESVIYHNDNDEESGNDSSASTEMDYNGKPKHRSSFYTNVIAFTADHVQFILHDRLEENVEAKARLEWLKDIQDVPFYSLDFRESAAR